MLRPSTTAPRHQNGAGASITLGALFLAALSSLVAAQNPAAERIRASAYGGWSASIEPFKLLDTAYYVGTANIGSYLLTTSAGHILIDTGPVATWPLIRANIETLGFKPADIKLILTGHAHFDHVQGHAAMKRMTGAEVIARGPDAKALEAGRDSSPLADDGWEPVKVDRIVADGDAVTLGDRTVRAVATPGHSPGCTTWLTDIKENDRSYTVAFASCGAPVPGVKVVGNQSFPNLAIETQESFRKLKALRVDIYLPGHPEALFKGKVEQLRAGVHPHPLATPGAWLAMVEEAEAAFLKRVQAESGAR